MRTDNKLTQALRPLNQPLPVEHSIAERVLQQLDGPARGNAAPALPTAEPHRRQHSWSRIAALAAGVLIAVSMLYLFQADTRLTLADVIAAVEKQRWAHVVYPDGSETWTCLEDGKFLKKTVHDSGATSYFMRDPATRTEHHYDGTDEIRLLSPDAWVLGRLHNGKTIPLEVDELTFTDDDLAQPHNLSAEERNRLPAGRSFEIVVEDGRKLGHFSQFSRDALGELQVTKELWVDVATKLPVRVRNWEHRKQDAQRVPRDGTFRFVDKGPADLYDFGVPRTVPVVPQITSIDEAKRLIPAETWKAIEGAKAAVSRFPHRFRVLTLEGQVQTISYVDSGDAHPFEWAREERAVDGVGRYFFADCQNSYELNNEFAELALKAAYDLKSPLPAQTLADLFPLDTSVNTHLVDGQRWFVLVRTNSDPRKSRLQVLRASSPHAVRQLSDQWEFADWNWTELATGTSSETAPAGQIVVHAERSDYKNDWFIDPERDYTIARHIEQHLVDGKWQKREKRAIQWERLPHGPWYVSVWETRSRAVVFRDHPNGEPTSQEEDRKDYKRIVITPLAPDDMPTDLFDGDKFLEAARATGAQIRVD